MDFDILLVSKSQHFAWNIVRESNVRVVCYRMCSGKNSGRILRLRWKHFLASDWRSKEASEAGL